MTFKGTMVGLFVSHIEWQVHMVRFTAWVMGWCLMASAWAYPAPPPDFTTIVSKYAQAVVNISSTRKVQRTASPADNLEWGPYSDLFKHFFGLPGPLYDPAPRDVQSLGSGSIISEDGYIVTNHHVIQDADEIVVRLHDRREFPAKLVGSDPVTDIALLKIEGHDLPVVRLGHSEDIQVGEWVLAVGSPFGFEHSVTAGIVSGIHRSVGQERYVPFIQTDAAINPGNSGGPLLNVRGEVIGVNAQILSKTGGYLGLSFSIPIDLAQQVVDQLKTHGTVTRGWLGIAFQDVDSNLAQSFGLDRPKGALVAQVLPDGPAEKAGIQQGDIVLKIGSRFVESASQLPQMVGGLQPGDTVKVTVLRHKKTLDLNVKVTERHDDEPTASGGTSTANPLGVAVRNAHDDESRSGAQSGVVITALHARSPLRRVGVRVGDRLLAVSQKRVPNVAIFRKVLKQLGAGDVVPILVTNAHGNVSRYVAIRLPEQPLQP